MARAQPDEFYNGLGVAPYVPFGQQNPGDPGLPKINYDYVWGMAADDDAVWFTVSGNVASYLFGSFEGAVPQESVSRQGIPYRAWELGASQYPGIPGDLLPVVGDWRPPRVFRWDLASSTLAEFTPDSDLRFQTLGLRSAVVIDGIVLMAGPALAGGGVVFFAFDAKTGELLGAKFEPMYSNIRSWVRSGGRAYAGVLNTWPEPSNGSILRWIGNRAAPIEFEEVGRLDNEPAYLAEHSGYLFAGTWPGFSFEYRMANPDALPPSAAIWRSSLVPVGGLTQASRDQWQSVWLPEEYEPDPLLARTYAIGAMHSFNGQLYWGTINAPLVGVRTFQEIYGLEIDARTLVNADRRCTLFRSRLPGHPIWRHAELLVGDARLRVYTPGTELSVGDWSSAPNRTSGAEGRYGPSGLGASNYYVWSIAEFGGSLYLGTYDVSTFVRIGRVVDGGRDEEVGGDVWCIDSAGKLRVVSTNGLQNPANHGFRNMASTRSGLFLGTANSQNLLGDLEDDLPDGGWELLRLTTSGN